MRRQAFVHSGPRVASRDLDNRTVPAPQALPSFPHLPGRALRRRRSCSGDDDGGEREIVNPEKSAFRSFIDDEVHEAPIDFSSPTSQSTLIRSIKEGITGDLSKFDFRHIDSKGLTPTAHTFLESLDATEFTLLRHTVLRRHAEACERALAEYAALETRLKSNQVFSPAINDQRVRAAAECDIQRAGGAIHLPTIAQAVVEDMLRALKLPGGLYAHVSYGVVDRVPVAIRR